MQPFLIQRKRREGYSAELLGLGPKGYWSIQQGDNVLDGLCWDEMLGGVARCLINGCDWPLPGRYADASDFTAGVLWEMRVEAVPSFTGLGNPWSRDYTLTCGDRFVGPLTDGEALGFIAAHTLNGSELFGGLKTYEEFIGANYWMRGKQIAGLLTYQPETAAAYEIADAMLEESKK